jgi:transmembrane sensor
MNRNLAHYQFEDFVTDESFINYCFRKKQEDIEYWQRWILSHPEKEILIEKATYYVRNFSITLPEDEYQEELTKIRNTVESSSGSGGNKPVFKVLNWDKATESANGKGRKRYMLALPAIVLLLAGVLFFVKRTSPASPDLVEKFNSGNIPVVFMLDDGSVVTLAPHSGLQFPRVFDKEYRKVKLNGEASFHVTADSKHPFKVYQDRLIATVLGTIFTIRKERSDSAMVVELVIGNLKIEITGTGSSATRTIMLSPNERVIYTAYNQQMMKEKWQADEP